MAPAVVIGNPVLDEIRRDGAHERFATGGTATYASLTLRALGVRVVLIGMTGASRDAELRGPLAAAGVELGRVLPVASDSTSYVLDYRGAERDVRLGAPGPRISAEQLAHLEERPAFVHVGPVAGEVTAEVVAAAAGLGAPLGIDLHALRCFSPDGRVRLGSAEESGLPFGAFDCVKGSLAELRAFAPGARSLGECLRAVARLGVGHVLATDGARGAVLLAHDELIYVPAFPVTEVDATGAGDAFLAAFMLARHALGETVASAGAFAAAAASFVVQGPGTTVLGSPAQVRERRAILAPRAVDTSLRRDWDIH